MRDNRSQIMNLTVHFTAKLCVRFVNYVVIILLTLVACIATAPADDVTSIVSQSQKDPNTDGSKSNHEAGNGTKAKEEGHLEDAATKKEMQTTKDEIYDDYFLDYGHGHDNITSLFIEKAIDWRGYFRG